MRRSRSFEDPASYAGNPPPDAWLADLLVDPRFIALVTKRGERVIGALAAYALWKSSSSAAKSTSTTLPWQRVKGSVASPPR